MSSPTLAMGGSEWQTRFSYALWQAAFGPGTHPLASG